MKKYKETYSDGYERQKKSGWRNANPTKRWYSKEFTNQVLASIDSLKAIKLTWAEIWEQLKTLYGFTGTNWTSWETKYHNYKGNNKIKYELNAPETLDVIAKAMNKKELQQKIVIKQRNQLNNELNIQAFRQMIIDSIKEHRWFGVKKYEKFSSPISVADCAYIISDEHYRGNVDKEALNKIYDHIEQDIHDNKYKSVELWYLGDGIDGLIHLSSLTSNDGAIKPAIEYANIVIERVNKIKEIDSIKFVIESNHNQTRPLGTNRNALGKEDLSFAIKALFDLGLRNNIKMLADWKIKFNYHGLQIMMVHGHQDFTIKKEKFLSSLMSNNENADIICLGHYHEYKSHRYGDNKWMFVAPTAKIWDGDYEKNKGFKSSGLITKLTINNNIPTFTPISVKE